MAKSNVEDKRSRWRMSVKNGLTAGGFITAVLVVLAFCFIFQIDMRTVAIGLAVVLVLVVGIPLFLHARRENDDIKDENATCQPIMRKYWNGHSTEILVKEYWEWTEGEHSSYSRVHFGGDVVGELQDAKAYEEALIILDSLESIQMKPRERYDYENYRNAVRPQLLEGIEVEKKREAERMRNKNLKSKK